MGTSHALPYISGQALMPLLSSIYYIKLKSRLSVCLSVRTFLVEWISAVGAQIDVKLARNEAPVFWADEVYF